MKAPKVRGTLPTGRVVEDVDPDELGDVHPLLRKLFPNYGTTEADEADAELMESLKGRQYRPILVAGNDCVSAPGMVLDGRRLLRAAKVAGLLVRVEYIDGLATTEDEEELIVHANLSSSLARHYDESTKAMLEAYVAAHLGRRQGQRTDLTSVHGASKSAGRTSEIVAETLRRDDPANDVTGTAVQERALIFGSPVSQAILRDAVNARKIPRRKAADMIRAAQKAPEVVAEVRRIRAEGLTNVQALDFPAISAARNALFAEVEKVLHGGKTKEPPKAKVTKATTATATFVDGTCDIENFYGRRVVAKLDGATIVLTDAGEAYADERTYKPYAPVTRTSWIVDVRAALDYLPADVRRTLEIGAVERLDPMPCPTCKGTRWRNRGGGLGTCPTCVPVDDYRTIRERVERAWHASIPKRIEAALEDLKEWGWVRLRADQILGGKEMRSANDPARQLAQEQATLEARTCLREVFETQDLGSADTELKREIRAAFDKAKASDSRVAWPSSTEDLRHPRQRIRISTPEGNIDVVLWERLADAEGAMFVTHSRAGIKVGPDWVNLGTSGGVWHSRSHLRNIVLSAVVNLVGHSFPVGNWWADATALKAG